jgi:flagellar motility protein MotE (MotC chaperone)
MKKLLTSTWMIVLLSGVVYLGATVAFWKTPVVHAREIPDESKTAQAVTTGPSWEFTNPEADQLMAEIKAEKKSLEKKESDLNDLSVRLQSERAELNLVTQSVQSMQSNFDENVLHIKDDETINLKKLGKVYAAMSPEGAAAIFAELDDAAIVKIMMFMKEAETGAILDSLAKKSEPSAKRAAALSERIRLVSHRPNTPAK